jgi:hypothetical protein
MFSLGGRMEEEEALEIERRLDEAMEKCHPPARF